MVIPADAAITQALLHEAHDVITAGHMGRDKTLDKLKSLYVWKNMALDVEEYVRSCPTCQVAKGTNKRPAGLLRPLPIPTDRWQVISMDFIVGLPTSAEGHDSIWTIVDKLTKKAHFIPVQSTFQAPELATVFLKQIFRLYGMPEAIVSDRDAKFCSQFWRALMSALGTNLNMSTPFHPQTDGQSEAANKTIEQLLRTVIDARQTNWEESLPLLEFAYNDSLSAATGFTPFYLDTGRNPRVPLMLGNPRAGELQHAAGGVQAAAYVLTTCQQTLQQARANIKLSQQKQELQANKTRRAADFAVGDKVMLSSGHLNLQYATAGRCAKLAERQVGPYTIVQMKGPNAAELDLPANHYFHRVQNVEKLVHFFESDKFTGRHSPPPPALDAEGEQVWEVEEIIGRRGRAGNISYLVKYKGYPVHDALWQPSRELSTCKGAIRDYEATKAPAKLKSRKK
jgi:hypothetical protein